MKSSTLQPCSPITQTYPITEGMQISIEVQKNYLKLPPEILFSMAARKNSKRSFLFVSKILGKHIPCNPYVSLLGGVALATCYFESINNKANSYRELLSEAFLNPNKAEQVYRTIMADSFELPAKTLFIGFAETATALGQSMFSTFNNNCVYFHTTREFVSLKEPSLKFAEEHSHAVAQRCYLNFPDMESIQTVVLIDDELTTGKTAINIIRQLHGQFGYKEFVLASLLDWRSNEDRDKFAEVERNLGICIKTVSLLEGRFLLSGKPDITDSLVLESADQAELVSAWQKFVVRGPQVPASSPLYLWETGRFGISSLEKTTIEKLAKRTGIFLRNSRQGEKTLCLGSGEFMYLPMLTAAYMGPGVVFQSTTRSPIHPMVRNNYGVTNGLVFACPDNPELLNFLYNVPKNHYDELYLFLERDIDPKNSLSMLNTLGKLGIKRLSLVVYGTSQSKEKENVTYV